MIKLLRKVFGVHVGLELGPRTVRVAWRRRQAGGQSEWQYVERVRSQDAGEGDLQRILAECLQGLRRRRLNAQLLLSAPTSHIRSLTVSVSDPRRLGDAVRDQLPTLLPFDTERAQVKFRVLRQQRVNGQWECLVSVAACEADLLRKDLDVLWQAGWGAAGVAPAALALSETAKALGHITQEPVVLLEIGQHRTTVAVLENAEVVYGRDITIGDNHLIEALMGQVSVGERTVSLTREQAEKLKNTVGIPYEEATIAQASAMVGEEPMQVPLSRYLAMIQPILEQLVGEVRRTMAFAAQMSSVQSPTRVLVGGEGSELPQFDHWLSKQLGVGVEQLNCRRFLGQAGATASVVCGLALLDSRPALDLQPPTMRKRWVITTAAGWLWRALAVATVAMWLGTGWWHVRQAAISRELRTLNTRWAALEPVRIMQGAVEARAKIVRYLTVGQGIAVGWFSDLARDFPAPIRLTELSVEASGEVKMNGEAQERQQSPEAYVSELGLWLEDSRVCHEVRLESSRQTDVRHGLVEFTVECQIP